MESYNAILIKQGKSQKERMELLHELAVQQMNTLETTDLGHLISPTEKENWVFYSRHISNTLRDEVVVAKFAITTSLAALR